MGLLDKVTKGKVKRPRRIVIYGPSGIGKTTFIDQAPDAVILPTEDGCAHVGCSRFPVATTCEQVMGAINELLSAEHQYKTLGLDSADWTERLIWEHIAKINNKDDISDIPYGKGYEQAATLWRGLLQQLSLLRDIGMTVIVTAHAQVKRFDDPTCEPYDRYQPKLDKRASALLTEWADEVLFAARDVMTTTDGEGGRERTRGVGGKRVLFTEDSPAHVAKNRLGMPPKIPLSWQAYQEHAQ